MQQNQQTVGVTRLEAISAAPFMILFLVALVLELATGNKQAVQILGSLAALFSIPATFVWGYGLIRNIREDYFATTEA